MNVPRDMPPIVRYMFDMYFVPIFDITRGCTDFMTDVNSGKAYARGSTVVSQMANGTFDWKDPSVMEGASNALALILMGVGYYAADRAYFALQDYVEARKVKR